MPTQDPQSVVSVQTHADGRAEIIVSGAGGTLTLEANIDGPFIAIKDHNGRPQALVSLKANGHLRGWFVDKKGDGPGKNTLVWFPAKKKRRTKKRIPKR
jgi:hypothetical protein